MSTGWALIGEAPESTIGLRLLDDPSLSVVVVGDINDSARIGDRQNSTDGIIGVAGEAAGRIGDGVEAQGQGIVAVADGPTDGVGDLSETDRGGDTRNQ